MDEEKGTRIWGENFMPLTVEATERMKWRRINLHIFTQESDYIEDMAEANIWWRRVIRWFLRRPTRVELPRPSYERLFEVVQASEHDFLQHFIETVRASLH